MVNLKTNRKLTADLSHYSLRAIGELKECVGLGSWVLLSKASLAWLARIKMIVLGSIE